MADSTEIEAEINKAYRGKSEELKNYVSNQFYTVRKATSVLDTQRCKNYDGDPNSGQLPVGACGITVCKIRQLLNQQKSPAEKSKQQEVSTQQDHQLSPSADNAFNSAEVKSAIARVLATAVMDGGDGSTRSAESTQTIADQCLKEIKLLGFDRYKFVCSVTMGEVRQQAVELVSRCLWNDQLDKMVSHTWHSNTHHCTVTVYGVYHD